MESEVFFHASFIAVFDVLTFANGFKNVPVVAPLTYADG
jgi:hypothetical protein